MCMELYESVCISIYACLSVYLRANAHTLLCVFICAWICMSVSVYVEVGDFVNVLMF